MATRIRNSIQQEYDTYRKLLPGLVADEGRYALIANEGLLGLYGGYADALEAGYTARGLKPFLVKRIQAFEVPPFLDREPMS